MQGKPAFEQVYNKDVVQMRSSFNVHILEMYIIYVTYNVYIYIFIYLLPIFHHTPKGPEQDQLRSPFVPYVRNTAERSIHNFDSGPYIYGNVIKPFCNVIKPFCLGDIF